jgi:para-aminobenzoate synthetase component 1
MQPVVYKFETPPSVQTAMLALRHLPGLLLLESSRQIDTANGVPLGRYSFLMADPFDWAVLGTALDNRTDDPLEIVRSLLKTFRAQAVDGLPPMQGGVAGLLSYDLNRYFESIDQPSFDTFPIPAVVMGAYDTVISWDHHTDCAWIVSQGFPEHQDDARKRRANDRVGFFRDLIAAETSARSIFSRPAASLERSSFQYAVEGPEGLTSNFSDTRFRDSVQRCVDYIYAGDVFQINLAQQLRIAANCDPIELYLRLKTSNPAPFGGYFDFQVRGFERTQIISSSPERLVSVDQGQIETRPIKGTRPRTGQPLVDIWARENLANSEKDIAENTMIVDLMRNDFAKVCTDDSVVVSQFCQMEEYASVMHLVSSVQGKLRPECDLTDLLAAIFPGGSITGAPKVRAMEIITELEPDARGAYCGSLGYLGFDGNADLNILIRTITAQQGWWQIPVGGGIVSQSNPKQEYDETWAKAAAMLHAVGTDGETQNSVHVKTGDSRQPLTRPGSPCPDGLAERSHDHHQQQQ